MRLPYLDLRLDLGFCRLWTTIHKHNILEDVFDYISLNAFNLVFLT